MPICAALPVRCICGVESSRQRSPDKTMSLNTLHNAFRPAPPRTREEFAALLDYAILIGKR